MIRYKDTILENYSINPVTAIITNSKGEIQKTSIHKNGYVYFKNMYIHIIQAHTNYGYKKGFDVHHIDENKLNNSLSNLIYLTKSEHTIIHKKGKHCTEDVKRKIRKANKGKSHSEETKLKISKAIKGERNGMFGKHHSEDVKNKISYSSKDRIWINNGVISKMLKCDGEIPAGFIRGRLKWKK